MLTLTCTSLLLQLITKSTALTKPDNIEKYWKTTYVTDHVPDYWNHGPIFIPGVSVVKKPDIFPSWLPSKEVSSTTEHKSTEKVTVTQVSVTETEKTQTTVTENEPPSDKDVYSTRLEPTTPPYRTVALEKSVRKGKEDETTEVEITKAETTTVLATRGYREEMDPVMRGLEEPTSEPFSVFLRKLLIVLSTKRDDDLPLLKDQFREYVHILLNTGKLNALGVKISAYIATRLLILEDYPSDAMHDFFDKLHKKLADRNKALPKEVNHILDYMDDTYIEAEEEAMQVVLRETYLYPNTKNKNKIAQGFVDFVFLKPLMRVVGTSRGKVLINMITNALVKLATPADLLQTPKYLAYNRKYLKEPKNVKHESSIDTDEHMLSKESKDDESTDLSGISSDLSESSEFTSSSEASESSKEIKERTEYEFRNNRTIKSAYLKKTYIFSSRETPSNRSMNEKQYGQRNSDKSIPSSTFTYTTSNDDVKTTESSDIETVLESKIYDIFKSMGNVNHNTSRTLKYKVTTKLKVDKRAEDSDIELEREVDRNISIVLNKLLNK